MIKIVCPKCKRVLGETNESMDAAIHCKGCKGSEKIKIVVAKTADYLPEKERSKK